CIAPQTWRCFDTRMRGVINNCGDGDGDQMKQWNILPMAGFVLLLILVGKSPQAQSQSQRRPNQQRDGERDTRSRITLRPGTTISVRVADEVNSTHNHVDDVVIGTVDPSVFIDNRVVIPRGTEAHLQVVEARKGG